MSSIDKVYNVLVSKKEKLTAKQISSRFSVINPYDTVYILRQEGYPIILKSHKDTKGRVTNKYHFGSAPQHVVAAGYQAIAQGLL